MALASGLCFAFYFLLLRHPRAREVNRASSVIYGNLLAVIVLAPWGLPALLNINLHDALIVGYLGIVQLGIAYALFTEGMARGVRSLDAGIICYIEPVLNPVWVFLVLGERPSRWALLGGTIIVVAVITHMLLDARGKRKANAAAFEARTNRQKRCQPHDSKPGKHERFEMIVTLKNNTRRVLIALQNTHLNNS